MEIIGVLIQSQQAAKKTNSASELETVQLSIAGSFNDVGNLDLQMLLGNLEKELPSETTTIETDNGDFPVTVTAKHGKYEIDGNGKIEKISGISLNKREITFTEGDSVTTETLVATLTEDLGGATVIWNSSNTGVATVDQNGVVSIAETLSGTSNTTEIKAEVEVNGENHSAKCIVTVEETVVHSIEVTVNPTTIRVGNTAIATTKGYGAFGTDLGEITTGVTYTETHEGDTAIATVSGSTIEGTAVGTATITASYGDLSDSCQIEVEDGPVEIGTLGSSIHGQYIDFGVDFDGNGSTANDWKIYCNDTDDKKVYIMTNSFLRGYEIPTGLGLGYYNSYAIWGGSDDGLLSALRNENAWKIFVSEDIRNAYKEVGSDETRIKVYGALPRWDDEKEATVGTMDYLKNKVGSYYPLPSSNGKVYGYWLASLESGENRKAYSVIGVNSVGLSQNNNTPITPNTGIVPVTILPSDVLVTSTGSGSSTVWHVVTETNP